MNKVILVSGTPGTGKTEIAKKIAENYEYEYVQIKDDDEYVEAREEVNIINIEKMINWIREKQKENNIVIDSHLSHYYPAEWTSICIITRCDPSELKMRLKKRNYPEEKINTNLEAEAIDLILQEAIMEGHKIHEVNTTHRTTESSYQEAIKAIDTGIITHGKYDFSYYITKKIKK